MMGEDNLILDKEADGWMPIVRAIQERGLGRLQSSIVYPLLSPGTGRWGS
jgi:hypothetical protein